ncbi:twin-arginine translocase subunit TatC [Solibacillus sp. MA9]|uniref:Sec-independent protein translocase protein TatC n=1 Tax=Solibacillus palustris TaxID=2908203 RepID=A0ABS9UIG1_9BACL|nr:twin-arginine translocase subunit TatC [Solibacillus sp. MA9]MCH7323955.1 twin-arginine translocase subunit TatC [Solibacillus sp. MA9]
MNPQELTLLEHMEELRKRLFFVAIFFVLALFAGFYTAKPIIRHIQRSDLAASFSMNAFSPADPLTVYLQMTFIIAAVIVSPILLYQLWAFITPGLHDKERKATLKYIPYAFVLGIGGMAFAYFILFPFVMRFMTELSSDLNITQTIGINEFFSFLLKLVVPFGILFQLPVVTLFVARLGIINPKLMIKFRKYAYFVLIVISVLLAPPDFVSNIIIAIPLFILYEVSIVISRIGYRKYEKAEAVRVLQEEERERELQVEELLEQQRKQMEQMNS